MSSHRAQLKQDDLWAKWMDVAFSKLDSNGDGYISLGEIVSTVPGSDDANDIDNHLIAVSQAGFEPSCHTPRSRDDARYLVSHEAFAAEPCLQGNVGASICPACSQWSVHSLQVNP